MAGTKKEHSLAFKIGAQLKSSFSSTFKNVEKQLKVAKKAAQDCGKAWAQFGKNASKLVLGATTAAAGVAAAVWKITDSIGDQALAVGKNASELRMTTEDYQKLQYAFERAGIGADDFTGVMSNLDRKMIELASDSKAAKQWGKDFGLSAQKLAKMSPEKRIERLADYFASLKDPIKRDQFAMEMFGKSAAEMERALGQGSKGLKDAGQEFVDTGAMIKQETVEQAEAYSNMKKKLETQVSGIKNQLFSGLLPSFETVFGTISGLLQNVDWAAWGEKIAAWVNGAVEKLPEIVAQIGAFIDRVRGGVQTVVDFVGGWENVAKIIGIALAAKTAISGVTAVIKTMTMVFKIGALVGKAFGAVMAFITSPVGLVVLAIAAVIAIVVLLVKNWDKVKEVASNVWNAIVGFVQSAWEGIKAAFAPVVEFFSVIWDGICAAATAVWDTISAIFPGFAAFVEGIFTTLAEFFSGIWEGISAAAIAVWEWIKSTVNDAVEWIKGIFEPIGSFISNVWETVKSAAKSFVDKVLNIFKPISDFFSGIGNAIASIFGGKQTLQVDVQTTGAAGDLGAGVDAGAADLPGHAAGGIFSRPHIARIAEGGDAEAVVPLNNKPASRSIWETAGRMAGFTQNTTNNSSEPVFNISMPAITINGNADAETVKQLKGAAASMTAQMREMVRSELAAMQREKARLSFG